MNKNITPHFQLKKINSDKVNDEPLLYGITQLDGAWYTDRRRFLKTTSFAIGSLIFEPFITGCGKEEPFTDPNVDEKADCLFCKENVGATYNLRTFTFTPDGKYLISSDPHHIKFWEMPSGILSEVFTSESGSIDRFVFSPDSKFVAIAGFYGWEIVEIQQIKAIYRSESNMHFLSFESNDQIIFYVDGSIKYMDIYTGTITYEVSTKALPTNNMIVSPDRKIMATKRFTKIDWVGQVSDPIIELWEVSSGNLIKAIEDNLLGVYDILFSPVGRYLIGKRLYGISVWDIPSGDLRYVYNYDYDSGYKTAHITHEGDLAILISGKIEIRNIASWELKYTMTNDLFTDNRFEISPNNQLMAMGRNTYINLWEVPSGRFITCLFDEEATGKTISIKYYALINENGNEIMYTSPCREGLPLNAKCTCDCVEGKRTGSGGVCNPHIVCSCVPVFF